MITQYQYMGLNHHRLTWVDEASFVRLGERQLAERAWMISRDPRSVNIYGVQVYKTHGGRWDIWFTSWILHSDSVASIDYAKMSIADAIIIERMVAEVELSKAKGKKARSYVRMVKL